MRWYRIGLLLAAVTLSGNALLACAPQTGSAPPDAYRGSECPLSGEIQAAWAGTGDEHWAVDVAIRESHCDPGAYNRSGASGVFQLMMPLHSVLVASVCGSSDKVFEPGCNIAAARVLYDGSGRRPWAF